ncbi:MAG: hypothetical protein ACOYVJ_04280 [Nitrospirota bacterium]
MKRIIRLLVVLFSVLFLAVPSYAEDKGEPGGECSADKSESQNETEARWGIQVKSVRLTAAGYMLDFRYRVTDSEKASSILNRQEKATLLHQESGTMMHVPRTRLGPMRQTSVKPAEDRDYLIFFANRNGMVKPGDKITVMIGDFKAEDLVVEE